MRRFHPSRRPRSILFGKSIELSPSLVSKGYGPLPKEHRSAIRVLHQTKAGGRVTLNLATLACASAAPHPLACLIEHVKLCFFERYMRVRHTGSWLLLRVLLMKAFPRFIPCFVIRASSAYGRPRLVLSDRCRRGDGSRRFVLELSATDASPATARGHAPGWR